MSSVIISRVVDNIKSNTTVFTPIVEVIVNAIQSIEMAGEQNGIINIKAVRFDQRELDGSLPQIVSFVIEDNGIGFIEKNRESFDTLYSQLKIEDGGKGFGRFTCLKYFENLKIESIFYDGKYQLRTFEMGKEKDIIINEKISDTKIKETGAKVHLRDIKNKTLDKKLITLSRSLVEILLPFFITEDYNCPKITLMEFDGSGKIILNDYIEQEKGEIKEYKTENTKFTLESNGGEEDFSIRIFKIYSPNNKPSKISLVAHKRSVVETKLSNYISEFTEDFYDKQDSQSGLKGRNYILKSYVFGDYLDRNVSLERGNFDFKKEKGLFLGLSQLDIEKKVAELTKDAVFDVITSRENKKITQIKEYVDSDAPWHRNILKEIDYSIFPYNPNNEEIELLLQKKKYHREIEIRNKVTSLLENKDTEDINENASNIVSEISESSKNDLIHYIALRKKVLDVFKKSLEINSDSKYETEGYVHNIIFPQREDSDSIPYEKHNLWIIDERLNFTNYVVSDKPLNGGTSQRPDIISYGKRIAFRGDNDASNPITIFEFKRPDRDDFVNQSSNEDPVEQIIRYVNSIKDGDIKTKEGRKINVAENTPFYGYVVCDITTKVEKWIDRVKMFKPMPDKMGWFKRHDNINLYIELISWDKLLKDAEMRNKVFFHKLGIH